MKGRFLADRYLVGEEIGRGGMGVVCRGHDPILDREVAIKMIPPSAMTPETERRFRREAQVVARMDHPGIVPVYDFGSQDGSFFLVMPLLSGSHLRTWLQDGNLRLGDILQLVSQIGEALDYSHSRGVVHRDIKPENLMVNRHGSGLRVRIMDFGLAREADDARLTRTGGLFGTVAYLSPEQASGDECDGCSDLYSVGVVLFECLAGEPPFSGPVHSTIYRIIHEQPQSLRQLGVKVPVELDRLVAKCIDKKPENRPQSGAELAIEAAAVRDGLSDADRSRVVVGASDRPTMGVSIREAIRAPLVGRTAEVARLQRRLNAAVAGKSQLVLIGGGAGTGKTRLLEELEYLCRARQIRVLRGRFADRDSSFPHQGLCELIQDFFRSKDDPDSLPDLSDLAPDLLALFPVFSELEPMREFSPSTAVSSPESSLRADPTRVFELLARTLIRLAGSQPLVLMIENLHLGEASTEALRYVFRRMGSTATLVVGTYRLSDMARSHPLFVMIESLADDPRFASLVLDPLDPEEFRTLIELRLGSRELQAGVAERLHEATEGNPFFAQELLKSLLESEMLRRDVDGSWALSHQTWFATSLPATIQQAVERRIERLPSSQQKVLAVASILGNSFDAAELEALLEDMPGLETDLDSALEALLAQEILLEERKSRGDRLRFSGGVIREVLYSKLSRRRRRSLHRRHAYQLEGKYQDRLERVYPQLVNHFSEADIADKTVHYSLELARRSLDAHSPEDAIQAVRTALEFVDDETIDDPKAVEGSLLEVLARAHSTSGDLERAVREAERSVEALSASGNLEPLPRLALFAANTAWQGRHVEETRRWVERGCEFARQTEQTENLRRLLVLGATVANLRGESRQARLYREEAELLDIESQHREENIPSGGTLTTGLPSPISTLDPRSLETDEEAEVSACVYETLLVSDDDGALVPALGEDWQSSRRGQVFEFTLRPDARFSDGQRVTAEDVKYSFERSAKARVDIASTALAAIEGFDDFMSDAAEDISGIEVESDTRIRFSLIEPLPIFPALLTNPTTAIVREAFRSEESPRLIGSGPFVIDKFEHNEIILEKSLDHWAGPPASLDRIVFQTSLDARKIADGLQSGSIDLGRDLLPKDLEEIMRDPRFRSGLAEYTKRNVYFVVFNTNGPVARNRALRTATTQVIRTHDLVWRTLGRHAQPAVGLIPPGILGHDPGRRPQNLSRQKARKMLREAGFAGPIKLRVSVLPLLLDRYGPLTRALIEEWAAIGIDVSLGQDSHDSQHLGNPSDRVKSYLESFLDNSAYDMMIGRWNADYDDPDDFTFGLFHSRRGNLRRYFCSDEADRLVARARQESSTAHRQGIYQDFEELLARESVILPLFHDVDYRVASPMVRGLKLRTSPPYVNYSRLGKLTEQRSKQRRPQRSLGGEIHLPISIKIESLDPAFGAIAENFEVISNIFETLTTIDEGANVVPHLASSFELMGDQKSYRFRLRPRVSFHDGRRLTSRDVRYSFERVLSAPRSELHFPLLPIRGAAALRDGRSRTLEGFHVLSSSEFVVSLERPLSHFPALLTHPCVAIIPEGTDSLATNWKAGTAGTGPFRVTHFEPETRLDLEKNPHHWRPGFPKSRRLSFHFGISPEEVVKDFRAGRLSLAANLRPADIEALRRDPEFASGYQESPRLSTYFLALNAHREPFSDPKLRLELAQALDVHAEIGRTVGRTVTAAHGLLPPGLLGYEPPRGSRPPKSGTSGSLDGLHTKVTALPPYHGQYASLWSRIRERFDAIGLEVRDQLASMSDVIQLTRAGDVDILAGRWVADYPDPDSFMLGLLESAQGVLAGMCSSDQLDALINKGRRESDHELRHSVYREIEDILVREHLIIPLFHDQIYRFQHPSVRGLRFGIVVPEVHYAELEVKP